MEYIGLQVTTYEFSDGKYNPVLSHIFWGKDLKKAVGIAKSHMISDAFFSSSFVGEMEWKNSVLQLSNDGELINEKKFSGDKELRSIFRELESHAQEVHSVQKKSGILKVVKLLSSKFWERMCNSYAEFLKTCYFTQNNMHFELDIEYNEYGDFIGQLRTRRSCSAGG